MQKQLSFWEQLGLGMRTYIDSMGFVFQKGLWMYFLYPLILALLMFYGSYSLSDMLSSKCETWLRDLIGEGSTEGWFSYVSGFLHFFLNIAFKIIFFFVYSTFSKYIILILMSPLMALLSEKTEEILTGNKYPFQLIQFMKDVLRGTVIALRNMLIEFSIIFICIFIAWIPVLGWITPLFLLVISYYFYGFSMLDYCCERKRMSVKEGVSFVRKNKGLAIGNGFIFSLLFAIPFFGTLLAPVLAPVAASISVVELEKLKK